MLLIVDKQLAFSILRFPVIDQCFPGCDLLILESCFVAVQNDIEISLRVIGLLVSLSLRLKDCLVDGPGSIFRDGKRAGGRGSVLSGICLS